MNIILIPSVGGGIGHIARTAILARELCKLDSGLNIEYLLDTERLRPFNIDAAMNTGFRVNLLPSLSRDARDSIVRSCLGQADLIIDDTSRYLIPLRKIIPHATWVSIPLFPMGDELFLDWPFLVQTEGIIWAYPEIIDFPPELEMFESKLLRSGPFLELESVPERAAARTQLGFAPTDEIVLYAPRGMPFGRDFGERVLDSVYSAIEALREEHKHLKLVLLAVRDRAEIRTPGLPEQLPDWVKVVGIIPQKEAQIYLSAADIAVTEGTSTTHEAAAIGTSILMIPGPIKETWLLGTRLGELEAGHILWIETVTPESVKKVFQNILLQPQRQMAVLERAKKVVTGGGGVRAAAQFVLNQAKQGEQR